MVRIAGLRLMEVPTREQLRKFKVVELRQKLSHFSLPQAGVKEDLITRLIQRYEEERSRQLEAEEAGAGGEEEETMDVEMEEEDTVVPEDKVEALPSPKPQGEDSSIEIVPPSLVEEVEPQTGQRGAEGRKEATEPTPAPQEELATPFGQLPSPSAETEPVTEQQASELPQQQVTDSTGDSGVDEVFARPNEMVVHVPIRRPSQNSDYYSDSAQNEEPSQRIPLTLPPQITQSPIELTSPPFFPIHTSTIFPIPPPAPSLPPPTASAPTHLPPAASSPTPPAASAPTHPPPAASPPTHPPPAVSAPTHPPPAASPPTHPPPAASAPSLPPPAASAPTHPPPAAIAPTLPAANVPSFPPPAASAPTLPSPPHLQSPSFPPPPHSDKNEPERPQTHLEREKPAREVDSDLQPPLVPPQASEEKTEPTESKGKKKKKKRRRRRHKEQEPTTPTQTGGEEPDVEIEYVQQDILQPGDPNFRHFYKVFEMFKLSEPEKPPDQPQQSPLEVAAKSVAASKKIAAAVEKEDSDEEEEEKEKEAPKISKKKLRKMNRLSVAQLKQLVERPDVVEMQDVTAQDPRLLIHLKSTRNTVPVPRHWCFKRKYLQGKRGIEKPPFNLPDFIKATGIMEMRQALEEKEEEKSLKQKTRERVRPRMGKLTIDYQKLHDAFFKWQTKPKMTIHGDLYYEGKEFETRLREKKPGDLSEELRKSLGMPTTGKYKFPPPWLVAMQRYGPPPSYPNLKIPGLNAPIPEGCSFGYFVGGWGKPPVDETGRPLYGDVFGLDQPETGPFQEEEEIDKTLWGELESEESEEEEEESEEEEEAPKAEEIQAGLLTPLEGLVTPSGLTSIPAGLETPEMIQLRKKKIEEAMEQGGETPALYTVLPEKPTAVGGAMMGSAHVYDIGAAIPGAVKKSSGAVSEGVEVALDPSELDLDTATMTARYEEQLREQQTQLQKEDLSDMVAEHAAKQKKRKRAAADTGGKATKKLKEFKF